MVKLQRSLKLFVGAIFVSTIFGSWSFKESVTSATPNIYNLEKFSFINNADSATLESVSEMLYSNLNLDSKGLSYDVFLKALQGYEKLESDGVLKNDSVITIVDFDQPSYSKRMYIIDLKSQELLYQTYTAHGRNSGKEYATAFSNKPSSNKSSLGFYVTASTYYGSNGYSLKLVGLEKGINDNALARAIVIHGADYVSENNIDNMGFLGRSWGCPALQPRLARSIIDQIKDGSCLFIYQHQYDNQNNLLVKN